MRFFAVLVKFLRESLREWGILLLALGFAPFFVLIFHVALSGRLSPLNLAVVNEDRGVATAAGAPNRGGELVTVLKAFRTGEESLVIDTKVFDKRAEALARLRAGAIDLLLVVPEDFSGALASGRKPSFVFYGDMASSKYSILLALAYSACEGFVAASTGREALIAIEERSLRPEGKMRAFDAMVPSLVILSLLTVMFTAAALFVREAEKGTITRLRLSRLTAFEYLGAATVSQLLVSLSCVLLTILTAMALGYRLEAPLWGLLLASSLAAFSVIAFGLVTAGLCSSVKDVMVVGNFPYFFMLLFSGVIPIPLPVFLTLAGHPIGLSSIFPMSFGIRALEGMMNLGRGPGEFLFEFAAMIILSSIWFAIGLALFRQRHLEAHS